MMRTLILIESGIFIGVLLISNLLRRFRRSSIVGTSPIHPLLFATGKLSMGVSWAFLFVPAANGLSSDIPIARACEYMAAALLLSGILFALPAFLELGYGSRFGISAQAGKLRTDGIYRASRNPMYLSFFMVTLASWLAAPRPANIICGLVGMYIHHRIVLAEERFLLGQHGALYEAGETVPLSGPVCQWGKFKERSNRMGITNSLIRSMLKQCRKPAGFMGTLMAWGMNSGHSEVTDWGLRHIQVAQYDTVLDVGCGGGATVRKLASLASRGKVYGIDYSDRSVAIARRTNARLIRNERVDIRQGSVSSLPFSENTFDLVTAVETHYFWPDLISDMQEVRRVLKPGGTLMIIGEVYKGGKESDTHRRWIEQGDMAYLSLDELGHVFAGAGFHAVQVFDESDRGWMCGMGQKLLSSFH